MDKSKPKRLSSAKKRIIFIVAAVIFVAMIVTIVYLLIKLKTPEKNSKDKRPTVVTSQNAEAVKATMDEPVPDGSYRVVMKTAWTFKGDTSDAYVENSKTNTRTVYFDVFLADSNELVYSSPYIPVGEKLQGFNLDADLEPGSYNGIVTYHLVDDDKEEVSNLSVSVTFEVK